MTRDKNKHHSRNPRGAEEQHYLVQALTDLDGGHVEAGAEGHNENHPFPRELAGQGSGHHHFEGRGEATMVRIPNAARASAHRGNLVTLIADDVSSINCSSWFEGTSSIPLKR